jgi:hypothetical protein
VARFRVRWTAASPPDGGAWPSWRADGQELFFMAAGACISLPDSYAAHPSGERFLLLCPRQTEQQAIEVLVNWQSLLRAAR